MSFPHLASTFHVKNRVIGFTLLEVLVGISIVGVLMVLAAPSLQDFFVKNNMRKISDDFTSSIFKAKNTAVGKNICTTMCIYNGLNTSKPSCVTSGDADWQQGWMVFMNPGCNNTANAPGNIGDILEIRSAMDPSYRLMPQASRATRTISFNSRGLNSVSTADEFDLIYKAPNHAFTEKFGLNICLDALGRTRSIPSSHSCSNYK